MSKSDDLQSQLHAIPVDLKGKKLMVRRQLKAELASHLDDSNLVAAYRQHGSVREAAKALTAERGTPITKDVVQRAIARAGGAKAVMNMEDSESVGTGERIVRTVERPAHVAKNRLNLPEELPLDYRVFAAHVAASRGEGSSAITPLTQNTDAAPCEGAASTN